MNLLIGVEFQQTNCTIGLWHIFIFETLPFNLGFSSSLYFLNSLTRELAISLLLSFEMIGTLQEKGVF